MAAPLETPPVDNGISELELREFIRRTGHLEHGCLEWVLIDPRSREVRGIGFFDDIDLLIMAAQTYADNYALQLCRNPRPSSLLGTPGARNQFNRSLHRPTPLENLDTLTTTVLHFRAKGKQTPDQVGALAAGLVGRLGIAEYSAESGGNVVQIRILFQPSPLRRFGGPEEARTLFARLEDHIRDSMTVDEKSEIELVPASGPDTFDSALGVPQLHPQQGLLPGRLIYAPSEQPDPVLDQLLLDLHSGKNMRSQAAAATNNANAPRTDGLITDWDEHDRYDDNSFSGENGILPKGAKLKIESEEGKQAKGQLENLEALSKDSYLGRIHAAWRAPTANKSLNTLTGGGSRPGELWLVEGDSYRAVQDWLCSGIESLLKKSDALVFWTSTRLPPGAFLTRGVERLTGHPVEDTEGLADRATALATHAQYKAQFKRAPVLFPQAPTDTAATICQQIQAFRHSDEALQHMNCLVILDGFDDLTPDNVSLHQALRAARSLAQQSAATIWLGSSRRGLVPPGLVDVHMDLMVGESTLRSWYESLPDTEPDKATTAAILPRLYPESAQGRLPCVVRSRSVHADWISHGYHLYYPGSGRFQSIVPKKET